MKQLFLFVITMVACTHIRAQIFTINAGIVLITNDGTPAELIIENSTKNIKGLLVNKGNGHTEFRQVQKLNDSMFVFGTDTFTVKGTAKGLQQVTDAGKTTTHYINAEGGYYQKDTLLLHATDSIIKVGFNAGQLNASGTKNTAIGNEALQKNMSGDANTAIGDHALQLDSGGSHNVGIGANALNYNKTGSYNVGIGQRALNENTTGNYNVGIGRSAGNVSTASYSIALGFATGASNVGNIAIGHYSTTGSGFNTAVGYGAMENFSSGSGNTAVGRGAFSYQGGGANGSDNTMIGSLAASSVLSGSNRSTIVGSLAGTGRNIGSITAIGASALAGASASGLNNISVGDSAMKYVRGFSNNTAIGKNAGSSIVYGDNNMAIGYRADVPSTTESYQLSIGNLIYGTLLNGSENTMSNGKIGIKTKTPAYELDVNGKLGVHTMDSMATAPNILWQDPATGEIKKAAFAQKQTFAQIATATVAGTSAETTLIAAGTGSLTIPASAWFPGKSFRIVVRGVYSSASSNPVGQFFKIKLGSTVIAQTAGIFIGSGKINEPFELRADIICRTVGASGTVLSRGAVINEELVVKLENGTSGTTVDLSSSQTINVTVAMNNNLAGNAVSAYIVTFEAIN